MTTENDADLRARMKALDDLEKEDPIVTATRALATATQSVTGLRADPLVRQLLKAFKRSASFNIDVDRLSETITMMDRESDFGIFELDGDSGLVAANEARVKIRNARSTVIGINKDLRKVLVSAKRIRRVAAGWLREQEFVKSLTAKATEEALDLILTEVTDTLENVDRLMAEVKDTISGLESKQSSIDAWFNLHKQYVFLNYSRGHHGDEKDNTGPARKLGRNSGR